MWHHIRKEPYLCQNAALNKRLIFRIPMYVAFVRLFFYQFDCVTAIKKHLQLESISI